MNPYGFAEPSSVPEYSMHPLKIRTKSCLLSSPKAKSGKHELFSLLLGTFLGFLIASTMRNYILRQPCHENKTNLENEIYANPVANILHRNSLLFVGVITADKYLSTRGKAVYETWGKLIPGKLHFFSSENSQSKDKLPLIRLEGVDDTYPPQKKSLMMLKYMYDFHIDSFEFFMRADDDLYVRNDRLETFLHSLNSSDLHYIGSAGVGLPDERAQLNLGRDNYCMGGPGVIFSRAALMKLGPYLEECLGNLKSSHEDVELGRCVKRYVGISCTWSYDMANIFHHEKTKAFFSGPLNVKEVHRAITLHPLKNPSEQYRVHDYFKSLSMKESEWMLVQLMREIQRLKNTLNLEVSSLDNPSWGIFIDHTGLEKTLQKWHPLEEDEVLEWDFLSNKAASQLQDDNPLHRVTSPIRVGINDAVRDIMQIINSASEKRGRTILFREFSYLYKRHHPTYGAEYIMDMMLHYKKFKGTKMTVPVRRHTYIEIPFGPLYIGEWEEKDSSWEEGTAPPEGIWNSIQRKNFGNILKQQLGFPVGEPKKPAKKITFILPLAGRFDIFLRFMDDFRRICLEEEENVHLIVVSFRPPPTQEDTRHKVQAFVAKLRKEFFASSIDILEPSVSFSRAAALHLGSTLCQPEDLLLFIDVDISFSAKALQRIRWHTIRGEQAYFPIVFSEFDPRGGRNFNCNLNCSHFLIDEETGYWRAFGYGIASIYFSDLQKVGGLNTSIVGWGGEDVDLFEKVLRGKLKVMRTADSDLVHIFHLVDCQGGKLDRVQLDMCKGSLYSTYASTHTLVKIIEEKPQILSLK